MKINIDLAVLAELWYYSLDSKVENRDKQDL